MYKNRSWRSVLTEHQRVLYGISSLCTQFLLIWIPRYLELTDIHKLYCDIIYKASFYIPDHLFRLVFKQKLNQIKTLSEILIKLFLLKISYICFLLRFIQAITGVHLNSMDTTYLYETSLHMLENHQRDKDREQV